MNFLTVLAWILAPLATIILALSIHGSIEYHGSLEQKLHAMQGREKTFPFGLPAFFVAAVTWSWIIAGGW